MKPKQCDYKTRPVVPMAIPCSGSVRFKIPAYFITGRPLYLCEAHANRWKRMHPFGGPVIIETKERVEPLPE